MATRPSPPPRHVTKGSSVSMRRFSSRQTSRAILSHRRQVCISPRSAELAGRAVALSIDVPAAFDAPLASHHRIIGRWAASRDVAADLYTHDEARDLIERIFSQAVAEILKPFRLAELRVVALLGDDERPPALAFVCDTIGQIELGWIEKSNALRDTLLGPVAPLGWRAAAYKALEQTIHRALPVFGFEDMMEDLSSYWDGETTDEGVIHVMTQWHGHDPSDIDPSTLPSAIRSRRPEWMIATNAAPMKHMPKGLRRRLRRLHSAYEALVADAGEGSAWFCATDHFHEYLPEYSDRSIMPPMTIVPADMFATEVDTVGYNGMEYGFHDIIGLCPIPDASRVDAWFASLKLGVDYLLAAQDLIDTNPNEQ